MIELVHLVKRFGDLAAVSDISLTVPRGEFFAVLGPNAAGKTTTIRSLAGLIKPTSGSARLAGFDVQQQPMEARRRLAYVPDFPFLYDKLTPWEFFRFTGQLFQMSEAQIQSATREWCGSSPTIGSSSTNTSGACSSAETIATRWRVPCESPSISLPRNGSRLKRATHSRVADWI